MQPVWPSGALLALWLSLLSTLVLVRCVVHWRLRGRVSGTPVLSIVSVALERENGLKSHMSCDDGTESESFFPNSEQ